MAASPSSAASRRVSRLIGLSVVGAVLTTVLAGCSVEDAFYFGWPRTKPSPQSEQMFDMWIYSAIAALAVGVFVWGLIFWCVIRYRKKGEDLPPQTRYNLPMELLFTVTPFIVIAVLFYYTAIIQSNVTKVDENPDQTIQVTAFKWNWQFQYPSTGSDPNANDVDDVKTTGDSNVIPILVVPTGQNIRFLEDSQDVIHSFWVPDLLFKRDVIPGVTNQFQVTINEPGAYVGRCAELCGTYHSMMNFEVRAVPLADYNTYLQLRVEGATTQDALSAIGQEPYAVTTKPFDTDRQAEQG
ncbi:aa3-type cytochrome oxidase subunit II [Phytomonospora endophytica]|uniref:Cytochrome c oxidase subunit 2 n=1 Tax=Phytomonospora endophytica TaxID=714109 RepID=A0A841FNK1_9ACTN|nr:cytochrome c oxidase subunit II [Phytomonospora endophytica]MBB6034797.1 cytochrome c oxidase subunit 2 [Phytomonospora endophytica]GIG69000.1 cytochrome c oxidase subunit II [Phytomonospora endophytica]